jgi:hypothetical protein
MLFYVQPTVFSEVLNPPRVLGFARSRRPLGNYPRYLRMLSGAIWGINRTGRPASAALLGFLRERTAHLTPVGD